MISSKTFKLTSDSFDQEVRNSNIPVLIDFWASWCGPCRAIAPILEQLATKYEGKIKIGKVNVDEEPTLASKFRVMSIPTLILFKSGLPLNQMIGLRSVEELESMIEKSLS